MDPFGKSGRGGLSGRSGLGPQRPHDASTGLFFQMVEQLVEELEGRESKGENLVQKIGLIVVQLLPLIHVLPIMLDEPL